MVDPLFGKKLYSGFGHQDTRRTGLTKFELLSPNLLSVYCNFVRYMLGDRYERVLMSTIYL